MEKQIKMETLTPAKQLQKLQEEITQQIYDLNEIIQHDSDTELEEVKLKTLENVLSIMERLADNPVKRAREEAKEANRRLKEVQEQERQARLAAKQAKEASKQSTKEPEVVESQDSPFPEDPYLVKQNEINEEDVPFVDTPQKYEFV